MPEAQTGFQKYDPQSSAPYQAPVLPDPTPAQPSPLPTQGPEINGAVRKSGAIATVADGILRGFMNGRAYHQAAQVMKLKKKTDDLQNSYNQDATRLYQLTQAGVDQNSDEYKAAKSSVDGSWGALMDFYGQHVSPDDDKGKKKSKKDKVEGGIMAALTGGDPMQQSQAWYKVAQKLGPPVYGQIAMLNTPQAKAQREAQATGAQNDAAAAKVDTKHIQNAATHENAQATYDKYAGMTQEQVAQLKPEDRQAFENAKSILYPQEARRGAYKVLTGKVGDQPLSLLQGPSGEFTDLAGAPVPEATLKAFVSDKTAPKAAKVNRVGKSMVSITDPNGKSWTPEEIKAGDGGAEVQAIYKSELVAEDKERADAKSKSDNWYAHADYSDILQTKRAIRALGLKANAADIKEWSKREDSANTAEEIYKEAAAIKEPTSTSDQKLLIGWVRSNNPGTTRLPDVEIKRGLKAGDYGTRITNAWDQAINGTLAPELHREYLADIRNAAVSNREEADHLKEEYGLDDDTLKAIAQANAPGGGKNGAKPTTPAGGGGFNWDDHPVVKP